MKVHPDIAALRRDIAVQRRIARQIKQAKSDWSGCDAIRAIKAELLRYSAGAALTDCEGLHRLLHDHSAASAFAGDWTKRLLTALSCEPLCEVPFRYRCSSGFSNVQIMQSGGAALSLVTYEPQPESSGCLPESVVFYDRESAEIVLNGSAAGAYYMIAQTGGDKERGVRVETTPLRLSQADCISMNGQFEARQILSADAAMTVLQLSRVPDRPAPSREYRLADGALLRCISGDKAASQRLMAVSVLGAMGTGHDAMFGTALDTGEDADVRWEALRQMLALNTGRGFTVLDRLAKNYSDPLSRPARQLRDQLMASEPAFAAVGREAA